MPLLFFEAGNNVPRHIIPSVTDPVVRMASTAGSYWLTSKFTTDPKGTTIKL